MKVWLVCVTAACALLGLIAITESHRASSIAKELELEKAAHLATDLRLSRVKVEVDQIATDTSQPPPATSATPSLSMSLLPNRSALDLGPMLGSANEPTPKQASLPAGPPASPPLPSLPSPPESFLTINSVPPSTCLLDGSYIGTTPRVKVPVKPGSHTIQFVSAESGIAKAVSVIVAAGETKLATVKLPESRSIASNDGF